VQFLKIKEEHLEQILKWRTSEFVTRYMYTDIEYDLENQRKWYHFIQNDPNSYYWLLRYKEDLIGLVSITDINHRDKRAYWNFYIGEPKYSMIAGFIGPYVYNYAFQRLDFHKLMGEVMEGNESVRQLHLKQGAREVGIMKDHIWKYERFHDVYVYEMTKSDWMEKGKRFANYMPVVEM
jgi:UDP-4-amino-4,6-dideoxy-N-acetyl-beta-L-altrosamine N-acetyltransferase